MELIARDGALGKGISKKADTAEFLIRVTSVRKILLDEDNLCAKYHIDCIRYAGIIPDDKPEKTHIEIRQRKVEKSELEHTVIEVFYLK